VKIVIQTIPHASHPYSTCGDWRRGPDGTLNITVSEEIGDEYALLVAVHELIEVALCEKRGITTEAVDNFDKSYEIHRPEGDDSEPGDDSAAPYRKEHFFATNIERLLAEQLGVDWKKYEDCLNELP
jgi:hypothetical protein